MDVAERLLLGKDSITVISLLTAICFFLGWYIMKQESRHDKNYKHLLDKYESEQKENKEVLVDLVKKSTSATEQTANAINTIKDVYTRR